VLRAVVRPALAAAAGDDDAHHIARIERARDHLTAGDVEQLSLARRLTARIASPGDALALYAALAEVAPAPYGALLEIDGTTLISASPERFLASVGDRVETRPATRRRGGAAPDAGDARRAAHRRTVDIAREPAPLAQPDSITDDPLGDVAELPGLIHQVSRVTARPRDGTGYAALLRAAFPAGSVTGAPRLRAMQLIDELEPVRRGPYCGALGYFGAHGAFDLALASRIMLAQRAARPPRQPDRRGVRRRRRAHRDRARRGISPRSPTRAAARRLTARGAAPRSRWTSWSRT
jgi:para-aminobenzoate synthetase component 1